MGGSKDSIIFKKKKKKKGKKGRGLTDLPKEVILRTNSGVLILFPVIFSFDIALGPHPIHGNTKAPETTGPPTHPWGFLSLPNSVVHGGFCSYLLPPSLLKERRVLVW